MKRIIQAIGGFLLALSSTCISQFIGVSDYGEIYGTNKTFIISKTGEMVLNFKYTDSDGKIVGNFKIQFIIPQIVGDPIICGCKRTFFQKKIPNEYYSYLITAQNLTM